MQNNGSNSYKSNLALDTQQGKENNNCFILMTLKVSANHIHTIEKHVNFLVYYHVTTYIKDTLLKYNFCFLHLVIIFLELIRRSQQLIFKKHKNFHEFTYLKNTVLLV